MLTVIKYVLFILLGLALFVGVTSYAQTSYDETLLPRPVPVVPIERFDGVGVLTFYAQSDGPQAWLLYETDSGVRARSIAPADCSATCLMNRYGGRQVRVTGILADEHINGPSVALATTTDDRIQFFTASQSAPGNASGVTLTPIETGGTASQVLLWADVAHDGTDETLFFKQGTLVPVGPREVTLLYAARGVFHFAVLLEH